jgi:hypothetical protein
MMSSTQKAPRPGHANGEQEPLLHVVDPQEAKNEDAAPLMSEALTAADEAAAPLDDLISEAMSAPDDFGDTASISPGALDVRKPKRDEWVRCHPTFAPNFPIYLDANNRDAPYLVRRHLIPLFRPGTLATCTLRLFINSVGGCFIWPLKHASGKGGETWAESRFQVANEAISEWRTIWAGKDSYLAGAPLRPDVFPTDLRWPSGTPNDWVHKAFPGARIIGAKDHAIILYQSGLVASPTAS